MSSSSDSEEFYDAEDITPHHGSRKDRKSSKDSFTKRASSEPNVSTTSPKIQDDEEKPKAPNFVVPVAPVNITPVGGRKKFKELRQKLQNDDEDGPANNVTPPNSQTSSVEGVFAASSKTSHPFRIIEQDTVSLQSINSLGRITRILGNIADGGIVLIYSVSRKSRKSREL